MELLSPLLDSNEVHILFRGNYCSWRNYFSDLCRSPSWRLHGGKPLQRLLVTTLTTLTHHWPPAAEQEQTGWSLAIKAKGIWYTALVGRYVWHCHATHKRRSPPSNYGREDLCAQSSCIPLAEAELQWAPAFAMLGKGEQCQKCMRLINLPLVHSRWEKSLVWGTWMCP